MKEISTGFNFRNTDIYKQVLLLNRKFYRLAKSFPEAELYGISNQLKRASVSIALNFAEGWARYNKREKCQFYKVARVSIFECVAILDIAETLEYVEPETHESLLSESDVLSMQFNGLIKSLS